MTSRKELAAMLVDALIKHPSQAADAALPGVAVWLTGYLCRLGPDRPVVDCVADAVAAVVAARLKIHQVRMIAVAAAGV